jgi:hypothetical protein
MAKVISTLLLLLLLSCSMAFAQNNWTVVQTKENAGTLYYDSASVKQSGNLLFVWTKVDPVDSYRTQLVADLKLRFPEYAHRFNYYSYSLARHRFNIELDQMYIDTEVHYDINSNVIIQKQYDAKWESIIPGTLEDDLFQLLKKDDLS